MNFSQERFAAKCQALWNRGGIRSQVPYPQTLHIFESVASTNQTAWDFVDQGAAEGTIVIALAQTAGRGQWGRTWASASGGLYLSVILTPDLSVETAAQLTLATAWGIANALRTPDANPEAGLPISLKWPNDLVIDGRKLGGILTETRVAQGSIRKAIVGIGINWTNPVPTTGVNLQAILVERSHPCVDSLEHLAALTLYGTLQGYGYIQRSEIAAILCSYTDLLWHRDQPIRVGDRLGTISRITPTGQLCLRLLPESETKSAIPGDFYEEICLEPGTISLGYVS